MSQSIGEVAYVSMDKVRFHKDYPYRKDLGYLDGLCSSMSGPNGLLQPIGLDTSGHLIFGFRRFKAAQKLGWTEILARVVDLDNPLQAIKDENEHRKGPTASELTGLIRMIELHDQDKEKAKDRQRQGVERVPHPEETGKSRDKIGAKIGVSGKTVDALNKIDANGTPTLKAAVDAGTVTITDAAKVATEPPKVQDKAVKDVEKGKARTATEAAKKRQPRTGKPIYDDRIIGNLLGKLAREMHNRMKAHGPETAEYKDMRKRWEDLNSSWKRWQGSKA